MKRIRLSRAGSEKESLLTIPEFAQRIRMSEAWTRKNIHDRRITVVRLGRAVRIPSSEISRLRVVGMVRAVR
jgi:excisionase family DNA binding protein